MKVIVHYSELALKGKNRQVFEDKLMSNIRLSCTHAGLRIAGMWKEDARIVIDVSGEQEKITDALQKVFGIKYFMFVEQLERTPESIAERAEQFIKEYKKKGVQRIAVATKRGDKSLPYTSIDINKEMGDRASKHGLRIDFSNPEKRIYVEITRKNAFMSLERIEALGGMPVSTGGKTLALFSGGIDSAVAAWMLMKRGCRVVSINPLVEPGLVKFIHPKNTSAVLRNKPDIISDLYLQPLVGGDLALLKGMIKVLLEAEDERPGEVLDHGFIEEHTDGFAAMKVDIAETSWEQIETGSGLGREEITEAARIYMESERTIICWAMGLTQQKQAVGTLQTLVNLLLIKGNIGKPGAGACPVRGHSNVQGDRTMGIIETPKPAFLDALQRVFGIEPPRQAGLNTVESIEAMKDGRVRAFFAMGGNFAAATPDQVVTESALASLDLTVQVSTKLNRSHLITGKEAYILPCLGRSEVDRQKGKPQEVTVEDSMSMVHASRGHKKPASRELLSEPVIVAKLARAVLPESKVDWAWLVEDYGRIRDKIAETLPELFTDFNQRIQEPGGFYLGNSARDREWRTATGKARFIVRPLPENALEDGQLRLMTMRSHDQFNTTIYGLDDRYRGVKGTRRVVFFNEADLVERGLGEGDQIDLTTTGGDGITRAARGFEARVYNIPKGCAAAYFPETNALVPLDSYAERSYTPTSKFIPVWVSRAEVGDTETTAAVDTVVTG
jgi:molybdopterin-dependent oxidoreductase alpha subunit